MKRMIPAELASTLCFESSHEDFPGWKQRDQVNGDKRRWSRTNTTIIEDPEGNFWAFNWEEGHTEEQGDVYPWGDRYDANPPTEIEVFSVAPKKITTVIWRKS